MGLFSRKGSKPAVDAPGASDSNSIQSNGSLKSPTTPAFSNGAAMVSKPVTPMPDIPLPKAPDPALDPAGYLRSIHSVRQRTKLVLDRAKKNQLKHFNVDMGKFGETAAYVVSIIKVSDNVLIAGQTTLCL